MIRFHLSLIVTLLSLSISAFAQKEFNHWIFHYGSVDFNQSPPSGSNIYFGFGSISATSITVSHKKTGHLQFYSLGDEIKNHLSQPMLNGHRSSAWDIPVFYFPFYSNSSLYCVFRILGPSKYLYYEIVDMNLNGGLGEIVPNSPSTMYQHDSLHNCLSGYKMVNKKSFWLITLRSLGPEISSFQFDENGLDTTPKVYNVPGRAFAGSGQSKFSPNGKKFAYSINDNPLSSPKKFAVLILDYDRRTSTFSNPLYIPADSTVWGVEFSPNSKLLYYTVADSLFQVNVTKHDSASIVQSKQLIKSISYPYRQFGQIQLGPDRSIYVTNDNPYLRNNPPTLHSYLSKIKFPDSAGSACNFVDTAIMLTGQNGLRSGFALPDIHGSFFRPLKFENACEGQAFKVTITDTVSLDSAKYDFGNPSSGSRNFGFGVSDTHTFSSSGQYLLTTIMYYTDLNGGVQIDSLWDSIYVIPSPKIQLLTTSDTLLCKGDSLFASVSNSPEYDFLWYDSSYAAFHSFDSSGSYWLAASNRCGVDTHHFNVHILQRQLNLRSDSIICHGDSILLAITDTPATYRWSNGSLDSSIWVSSLGKYWGEMTNLCGTFSDTVQVFVDAIPSPDLGLDTTVCKDALLFFSAAASGPAKPRSYLWNSGDTFSQVIVKSPGLHWVQVSNACGVGSDSVWVNHLPSPSFSISPDSAFCSSDSIQLSFSGLVNYAGTNDKPKLLWSNGSTDSTIWMSDFGWVSLQLTNQCGIGVDSLLVTELLKPQVALPTDIILCNGTNHLLSVSTPKASYRWQDNSTNPVFSIASPGVYAVTVTNPCGVDSAKVRVVYQEEPTLSLSSEPSTAVCIPSPIVLLSSASGGGLSYLWSTGDSSEKITVTNPGTFSLTVTSHCGVTSHSIAAPFVDLKADFVLDKTEGEAPFVVKPVNQSVGSENYDWFLDSTFISNIKDPRSKIISYGPHTLMLIVKNGSCSDTTAQEIEVLKNKNLPPRLCDFEIRPNPILTGSANDAFGQQFFILAQNNDKQVREIKIMNTSGAVIYQTDVSHWKENPFFWQSPEVNLSLASGTYLVGLVCENETVFKRLVVE